jgi:hypothetical protein
MDPVLSTRSFLPLTRLYRAKLGTRSTSLADTGKGWDTTWDPKITS